LAGQILPEMTCNVSSATLNPACTVLGTDFGMSTMKNWVS